MTGPCTSSNANEGVASLDISAMILRLKLLWSKTARDETYPFHNPDHAPVADPGFTKKRPSFSYASNLVYQLYSG
jgi:hypothetical protein